MRAPHIALGGLALFGLLGVGNAFAARIEVAEFGGASTYCLNQDTADPGPGRAMPGPQCWEGKPDYGMDDILGYGGAAALAVSAGGLVVRLVQRRRPAA